MVAASEYGPHADRGESIARLLWRATVDAVVYAGLVLAVPIGAGLAFVCVFFLVFSLVNPPWSALMVWRSLEGRPIKHQWAPIEQISPNLIDAVIASEDARFCQHYGIDFRELDEAFEQALREGGDIGHVRGASTISMQVVKNMLLWPGRNVARKGLELMITPLMELMWSKRRILEVYLNIAEWGPGIYGVEAASWRYFKKPAGELSPRESALLAAALPNPIKRRASRPSRSMRRKASRLQRRARGASEFVDCIY
jgi:monofunctional biosynthetic peptidoglycan transglycosylase